MASLTTSIIWLFIARWQNRRLTETAARELATTAAVLDLDLRDAWAVADLEKAVAAHSRFAVAAAAARALLTRTGLWHLARRVERSASQFLRVWGAGGIRDVGDEAHSGERLGAPLWALWQVEITTTLRDLAADPACPRDATPDVAATERWDDAAAATVRWLRMDPSHGS